MLSHLLELRRRALYVLISFGALFLFSFYLSDTLFHGIVQPLLNSLNHHEGLIATQITSPVLTPLKLAADIALLFTTPIALHQLWQFVSPALYLVEKKLLRGALLWSILLFLIGVFFCFYIVLPFMFQFFAQALPAEVRFMPDIVDAIDFITRMLLLFGLCFQVPLICKILVKTQILDLNTLKLIRPYVIVGAFTIGMLLTPPDVFSQILLALPLCLLYELGILLSSYQKIKDL